MMTEHIVFFSKGGIGTSTLISNICAALVETGFRVLLIGCSPKGGSCSSLNGGLNIPTVLSQHTEFGVITFDSIISRGFKNIYCIELGSLHFEKNGSGTAQAVDLLLEQGLISSLFPDFVFYDISGDRSSEVLNVLRARVDLHRLFAVTTPDFKSLYFVNTILAMLDDTENSYRPILFGGVIPNVIASSFDESFISDFAKHTVVNILNKIPRSLLVRQCELYGKTVIEASPLSNQSYFYRRLANQIVDESRAPTVKKCPKPLTLERLNTWAHDWADRLYALENGLVGDGAAI